MLSQIKITTHVDSGKLAKFKSINTSVEENDFCSKMRRKKNSICMKCYAVNMEKRYPSFRTNIQSNSEILSSRILDTHELPRINDLAFRFHSTGELINDIHFLNFINIAVDNSRTYFTLWTKRVDIIKRVLKTHTLPDNLKLIYSNPKVDSKDIKPPKHFVKVFTGYSKDTKIKNINCKGKCVDCMLCYSDNNVKNIREIIK